MAKSIKILSSQFPKSIEELQNLFETKTNIFTKNSRDNVKFHSFLESGEKIDISDLNIFSFRQISLNDKIIDVFHEKLDINININYYNVSNI